MASTVGADDSLYVNKIIHYYPRIVLKSAALLNNNYIRVVKLKGEEIKCKNLRIWFHNKNLEVHKISL